MAKTGPSPRHRWDAHAANPSPECSIIDKGYYDSLLHEDPGDAIGPDAQRSSIPESADPGEGAPAAVPDSKAAKKATSTKKVKGVDPLVAAPPP